MSAPIKTPAQIAMLFGTTTARVRTSLQQNAAGLRKMAISAERKGKPVNGYSAELLNEMAFKTALQALL